ncbi:MAG: hypothetical protein IJ054_03225 [Lachnospiraceae bacterium]|nr:hypothetical protein [Lachnospiraceae bacterium]
MKKKILTITLAFAMCFTALTACGKDNSSSDSNDTTKEQSDSSDNSDSAGGNTVNVDVALTDATGSTFTIGVADGWKLMTPDDIGSFMEGADFIVKGDTYDAMGEYIQISQTTGSIDEWVEQTKNDSYVTYDGEYNINGITWYMADRVAGAEIDGKIVLAYPQNGVSLKDEAVEAMLGSIRWANGSGADDASDDSADDSASDDASDDAAAKSDYELDYATIKNADGWEVDNDGTPTSLTVKNENGEIEFFCMPMNTADEDVTAKLEYISGAEKTSYTIGGIDFVGYDTYGDGTNFYFSTDAGEGHMGITVTRVSYDDVAKFIEDNVTMK